MTERSKRLRRPTRGVLSLHLLMIALIILPHPVTPATITVDGQTGDAPGTCDLVEAIENAEDDAATNVDCVAGSGDDEIVLTENVVLTASADGLPNDGTGLPRIEGANGTITIQGNDFRIRRAASATDKFRIFSISEFGDLTLNDVTLSGGLISATDQDSLGGAIFNRRGTLTLSNSTISGNVVSADPAYPNAYGGGIYNTGIVTLVDSTVSNNRAVSLGDVQMVGPAHVGGAGISNCSGLCSDTLDPQLTLTSSTISGNTAESAPGDVAEANAFGAGVYGPAGDLVITNSTISGNNAIATGDFSPGAYGGGIEITDGALTLRSSTISNNLVAAAGTGSYVGGAGIEYFGLGAGLYVYDSVLGNHPGLNNCYGITAVEDGGGNLSDDASCGPIPSTLTGLTAVLADNGGPTETHALIAGSTAIDNAGTCGLATDQRGETRPADFCDSGAYEVQPCAAADGDSFVIADGTMISSEVTIETCSLITTDGAVDVMNGGHLILRTAGWVEFNNGFVVTRMGNGNALTVEIDDGIVEPGEQ